MDPQLKAQLRQVIHVASLTSVSAAGDPSFGAAVAVNARVEDDVSNKYGSDEVERESRKRIVTESAIRLTDRVWMPGDSETDATLGRTPMSVQELPDELGVIDHYETVL
jgi:hypothetical protein